MVTTSEVLLKYTTDKQSLNKTLASEKALMKSQDKLADSASDLNNELDGFRDGLNSVSKASKSTIADVADFRDELNGIKKADDFVDDLADSFDRVADNAKRASKETKGISTSAKFGAEEAGDVAGRTAQIRGALTFAGGGDIGAAGVGLEGVEAIADLGEALPKLKEAVAGLPAKSKESAGAIKGMAKSALSLGPAGLAAAAAVAVLAVGVGIAAKGIRAAAQEMKQELEAFGTVSDTFIEEGIGGLQRLQEQELENIRRQEARMKEGERAAEEAGSSFVGALLGPLITTAEEEGERFAEAAERSRDESQAILDEIAETHGDVGNAAEEAEPKVAGLAEAEKLIAEAANEAAQVETEAAQQREEAAQKAQEAADKVDQANQKYTDSIKNVATQATNALKDAKTKNKDAAKDLSKSLSDDLFEDIIKQSQEHTDTLKDSRREDLKDSRDHEKSLKKIQKDGAKSQRDAARDRDFLALAEAKEATQENVDNAIEERQSLREERQIALDDKLVDLRQDSAITRAERMRDFERDRRDLGENLQRQFRDIHTSRGRQLKLAAEALSKELKLASEGANKALQIEQKFWQARLDLASKAASIGSKVGRTASRSRQQTASGMVTARTAAMVVSMGMFD